MKAKFEPMTREYEMVLDATNQAALQNRPMSSLSTCREKTEFGWTLPARDLWGRIVKKDSM